MEEYSYISSTLIQTVFQYKYSTADDYNFLPVWAVAPCIIADNSLLIFIDRLQRHCECLCNFKLVLL